MTAAPKPQRQPKVSKIDPPSDSRLASLLTEYSRAKDEETAAKERAAELQSQIRATVLEDAGDDVPEKFEVAADPHGGYPGYTFYWTAEGWTCDTKRMKSEDPETWVKWAKKRDGFWTFKEKQLGRGFKR